jgi:hypothetical protein
MRNDLLTDALTMLRAAGFAPHVVRNRHNKRWDRRRVKCNR